jgi:ketosteroid isomerase-like protein
MASPQDLETVHRIFEAFNRRDVDGLTATLDPEMEWHPLLGDLGGGVYRGHEGARRLVSEINETWEAFRIELEDLVEAGELIFVFSRSHGRGRGSGLEADIAFVTVLEMREGRLLRGRSFATLEEALAAAGLERLPAADSSGRGD